MQVMAGSRLGPYEIVAPIGAGGMGEVYKARDTRLDRSVAIKILPAAFADNAQLKIRFEREAKTISQLTHPNICTLYDVGNEGGVEYLVMELLEGDTLADRLARGPLPMRDVLRYGREIAAALDRAHRAGVVHRDLKPGNVMITKSGAKLLDFGLAKGGTIQISPDGVTQQKSLTQEGTILGTFQYMAPEQLEGIEADTRTDIFALGALLYEMATGRRAFDGKTKTSLIAAIVGGEPKPIREFQPLTPPAFEHVVTKCLAKDLDHRWQSASDVASELEWIGGITTVEQTAIDRGKRTTRRRAAVAGIVATAVIAAAVAAAIVFRKPAAETPMVLSIAMPQRRAFDAFGQAALSPDGSTLVFVGNLTGPTFSGKTAPTLWLRTIDRADVRLLPGTQGASEPFWSPDGKSIGFFAERKLKRIAAEGGPPRVIADAPSSSGGTWNRAGVIVFCPDGLGPLVQVDANGGTPRAVTKLTPQEEGHRWPSFLPDGDHFLYLGDAAKTENHHLKVGSLRDGSSRDLMQAVTNVTYVAGQLFFVRAGALMAQPFDAKSMALSGEPHLIAENVLENDANHHFEFTASENGRLVYRSGSSDSQLMWVDRSGKSLATLGDPRRFGYMLRISPDQQHVIAEQNDADGRSDDLWMFDAGRGVATRFTFDPASERNPVWSPDGTKVAFSSMRTGLGDLYLADASSPSNVQRLTATPEPIEPTAWSRDGMLLCDDDHSTQTDILMISVQTKQSTPYLATRFNESSAALSPDNSRVAYVSDESGRLEVYVEHFPSHAARRQVSINGGTLPAWRGDGRELFFAGLGGDLMSVDMTSDSATPKPLFHLRGFSYDVTRDGQRFIVDQPVEDTSAAPLTFVSNWMALRK
ncbi:MAG: protein kinase [Acidobacteria bacterium]|nr:protein kinase [Acidobacteriota bacterium]